MQITGDVAVRTFRTSAALALCALILGLGCDREPSGPNAAVSAAAPPILRVARARIIEPGDRVIPNPPVVDAWIAEGEADRLNMAFDVETGRFFVLESPTSQLVEMAALPSGGMDRLTMKRMDAGTFGVQDARGLAIDPSSRRLFILDGGRRILRLDADQLLGFHQPRVSSIQLAAGLSRVRGLAFDAANGHFYVLDPVAQVLHELNGRGEIVATRDVSEFRLHDPRGLTLGPTGDRTDDPSEKGVYVAAGGRITELSLATATAVTTTAAASLVRTTLTSQFSPASPDPSGLAYITHLDNLMIVDGEVEEMSIYAGANAWETTRSGTLTRSWTTIAFADEPTGAAYNPANRFLFLSDDDARDIFVVNPGGDGRYGTGDDSHTRFDTVIFGCDDPEGVAYDAAQNALYIADGVGAEVWRVTPGSNGRFDGVAPAGDDQVTHWDTGVHGLVDPEGIAWDSDFGHLYVGGKPNNLVFHFTTTGTLLRTVSISLMPNPGNAAGLEYAPSSASAGTNNLYIVDRKHDNDSEPDENDGTMYEFSLPPISGNTLPSVTITAPDDDSQFAVGSAITFTGNASDLEDGDLTSSIAWTSSVNGSIGSGGSVTTSTLSLGTHTITASVTDAGKASRSASIVVTVFPEGVGFYQARVAAGTDDAEESASGSMQLTSSDLELVNDGSDQLVGMRFQGVTIPRGATISSAYVQFQTDEVTTATTALTIRGQAADNPATFSSTTAGKISTRTRTASAVSWSPVAWTTVEQAGAGQRTPNIASVIQEIVNRTGWTSGNSLVIIINGTGKRTAEAYDGEQPSAPLLRVDYATGPNTAPSATNVAISGTAQVGRVLTGNYTYSDAQSDAEGASTYRWLRDGIAISGATARTYALAAADEGAAIRFEVTPVAATGASPGSAVLSPPVGPVAAAPPNSAPTATNVSVSGTVQVGRVLTGSYTYGDADGDMEGASTYRWLRSGVAITGATARTYTLVAADQGAMIRFEVTPVAVTGASPGAPVQSSAVGPVAAANNAPVASNVTISGTPQVGQILTGTYTYTDSEADLEGASTYRWLRAGAPISGATARTYTLVAADEGALIRFEVTPVAATGTSPGTAVLSPSVGPVAGITGSGVVQVRVSARADDAEEGINGVVSTGSSDLELVNDGATLGDQLVGIRFTAVTIPRGATITNAFVQFQADATSSTVTSLTIRGEAADNAVAFSGNTGGKVSTRARTTSAAAWSPLAWTVVGQAGANQQTPNLTAIIQEIVNRPGWTSGNSLVIIINGTGKRTAAAFDGKPAGAPLLRVDYSP
jgi:hypothetical protein